MNKTRIVNVIIRSVLLSIWHLNVYGQDLIQKKEAEPLPAPHKLVSELEEALERTNQWKDCQLEVRGKVLDCVCLQGTENRIFAKIYRVGEYIVQVYVKDIGGGAYFMDVWGDARFKKDKDEHHGLPLGYRKQYKDLMRRFIRPVPWYVKVTTAVVISVAVIYGSSVIMRGGF